jgi:hypothetical protein
MLSVRTGYAFSQDRLCIQSGQAMHSVRTGYAFSQDNLRFQSGEDIHLVVTGFAFTGYRLYDFIQERLCIHKGQATLSFSRAISIYLGPALTLLDRLCVQLGQIINSIRTGYAFIQDRLCI